MYVSILKINMLEKCQAYYGITFTEISNCSFKNPQKNLFVNEFFAGFRIIPPVIMILYARKYYSIKEIITKTSNQNTS